MCGGALHVFLLLCVAAATVSWTAAEVIAPVGLVAEVEHPLLLSCNVTFGSGNTLHQVRWYDSNQNLLLAYQPQPFSISHQDDNVQLVESRSDGSSIRIVKVRPDGGGCYHCAFNVFPLGEQKGQVCIELTVPLNPRPPPTNHGSCHTLVGAEWRALTLAGLFLFWLSFFNS